MITYSAAFLVAMVIASMAIPVVRQIALHLGAVSQAGGRNINTKQIPRLGGIAIAVAVVVTIGLLLGLDTQVARLLRPNWKSLIGLGVGAFAMCLLGVADDTRGVRATRKLAIQIGLATLAYFNGFQIQAVSLPLVGVLDMGIFALPVTVFWIVGITNAVNLIDGLDGLAAGVVFCAAGTNFVVAYAHDATLIALVMATLMGALMGFLFYNFNPAKIFMGDSGSYFLGFVIATTSLAGNQKASTAISLLVPVLALGVPIFDTLFSIVRRTLERRSIFSPDRGHLHHRLLDIGLTHQRAVLTLYLFSLLFALAGVAVSIGRDWHTGAAILGATILIVGLVAFVRSFDRIHSQHSTARDELLATLMQRLPTLLRNWRIDATLEFANEQISQLGTLPQISKLHFITPTVPPSKVSETLQLREQDAPWILEIEASSPPSPEALALLRLVVQMTAESSQRDSGESKKSKRQGA